MRREGEERRRKVWGGGRGGGGEGGGAAAGPLSLAALFGRRAQLGASRPCGLPACLVVCFNLHGARGYHLVAVLLRAVFGILSTVISAPIHIILSARVGHRVEYVEVVSPLGECLLARPCDRRPARRGCAARFWGLPARVS